ncbi:MAG: hypothetical protein U0802_17015 [Candidatus Binatia bacterium]
MRVLANLADADESDIGRPPAHAVVAPALAAERAPAARRAGATTPIGWALFAAAATLLVLEWLLARRRT